MSQHRDDLQVAASGVGMQTLWQAQDGGILVARTAAVLICSQAWQSGKHPGYLGMASSAKRANRWDE